MSDFTEEFLPHLNDVHFGIHRDHVERFRNRVSGRFLAVLATYADGDGWNVWAESPGDSTWDGRGDNNDPDTLHVVVRVPGTDSPDEWVASLVEFARATGLLVPFSPCNYQGGEIAVLTDSVDWSVWNGGPAHTWR